MYDDVGFAEMKGRTSGASAFHSCGSAAVRAFLNLTISILCAPGALWGEETNFPRRREFCGRMKLPIR